MHIRSNFYREYFIEKIEEIVDRLGTSAAYPHPGLGPDQRFASRGGYIVGNFTRTGRGADGRQ